MMLERKTVRGDAWCHNCTWALRRQADGNDAPAPGRRGRVGQLKHTARSHAARLGHRVTMHRLEITEFNYRLDEEYT